MSADDLTHVVYRHFDSQHRLLYVGMTNDIDRRNGQHRFTAPWWNEVRSTTWTDRMTFSQARRAEQEALTGESPLNNTHMANGHLHHVESDEYAQVAINATPSRATQNGYAIRAFREKAGLSVQWLADAVNVSAPHIRNIENEHRNASNISSPTPSTR